ncbi:MAG: hypothetical protein O3B73_06290 [bacterium]|nr:hypothetical protein [bacterium]
MIKQTRTAVAPVRPGNPSPAQPTASANTEGKHAIFVVFASTIDMKTMKKLEHIIIGIYENTEEADVLEKKFNEVNEGEKDGHFTKAYSVRYVVPYLAPMIKRTLDM